MKCIVLLFFGVLLVQAYVVQRQKRQAQDDPAPSEGELEDRYGRGPRRWWMYTPRSPVTTTTTTTTTSTTTQRPYSTSIKPDGVIHLIPNCNCASTPQFNPVCGTDGNTYANSQKLQCTKRCGYDVEVARMGTC